MDKATIQLVIFAKGLFDKESDAHAKKYLHRIASQLDHELIPSEKVYSLISYPSNDADRQN